MYLKEWIEETTGVPSIILSDNFSSRVSVKLVEGASFFVGTHSSMQCAASVYNVPSLCIGPNKLYLHNYYAPNSFNRYLKPLYINNNVFMQIEQIDQFAHFFDYFLKNATSLQPCQKPELFQRRLSLSNMVFEPFQI